MTADPVLDAIQAVREDVRANHEMLTRRIDQMVSKDVHDAEIRRIDAALDSQRSAFDSHVALSTENQAALRAQVIAGDNAILSRMDDQDKQLAAKETARMESAKTDRRWMLGWVATLCTIAVSIATFVTRFF